jgi:hypothetical protein
MRRAPRALPYWIGNHIEDAQMPKAIDDRLDAVCHAGGDVERLTGLYDD